MNFTPYSAANRKLAPNQTTRATFFAAVPPPWEALAATELYEKLALLQCSPALAQVLPGGVEFSLPLREGLILNHYLKIPSRILLRLATFKCRDFPTLYQKCRQIFWGQFINQLPAISFSATHSRLVNSAKAQKAIHDAVRDSWHHFPPGPGAASATVFIRLANDTAQISLDTSGERLDRRHYRTMVGRAPLRENLAAAMLYQLAQWAKQQNLPLLNLFSPMCGAGTFLTEAASFYYPLPRPYAYQNFPLARKVMIPPAPQHPLGPELFAPGGWGMDLDEHVLAAAKANENNLRQQWPQLKPATWQQGDVLLAQIPIKQDRPLAIIINPPLNRRLKLSTQEQRSPAAYYLHLGQQMRDFYRPSLLAMLLPPTAFQKSPLGPPPAFTLNIYNGGQAAIFACWAK